MIHYNTDLLRPETELNPFHRSLNAAFSTKGELPPFEIIYPIKSCDIEVLSAYIVTVHEENPSRRLKRTVWNQTARPPVATAIFQTNSEGRVT